jgi:subtilase family serine protease
VNYVTPLTALICCLSAAAASAAALPQDLGVIDQSTAINATIWLQPHDQAAFEAAVRARQDRASAAYHHWMTPAELTSYNATKADIAGLSAALVSAGLTIDGTSDDNAGIAVSGSAATLQAAFGTSLHVYRPTNGRTYYAPTSEPAFKGAHAEMIAGITGLSSAHMAPYVTSTMLSPGGRQIPAAQADTGALFTDKCFVRNETVAYHQATSVSYPVTDLRLKMTGPGYIATGVAPAKTCAYTPAQVAAHYGLTDAYAQGFTGAGQTIVIVDAFGSPSAMSDANIFAKKFKLTPLDDSNFSIVYPSGKPVVDPYTTTWPTEIALDIEWAHAMAPDAKIVLVAAFSDDDTSLAYALNYAVVHGLGDVISNSYGEAESTTGAATARAFNSAIRKAAAQGIAVDVSTGDSGDFGLNTPAGAASIPADSPYATAVGGTSLGVPSDNGPVETAWGTTETVMVNLDGITIPPIPIGFQQGGGGGESNVFRKPIWQTQAGLPGVARQLPDVSAIADPFTGAIIVATTSDGAAPIIGAIGGTSLASPVFSGVWALAQQQAGARLGQAAPIIAAMPAGALIDILPISATRSNLSAKVSSSGGKATYDPAELLDLSETQPTGFVGALAHFKVSFLGGKPGPYALDVGFGADSSLRAGTGWDNATGFGVPNGQAFFSAADAAAH